MTIVAEGVYILNPDGNQQHKTYIEYAAEQIHSLYQSASELREKWVDQKSRSEIVEDLKGIGVENGMLGKELKFADADPFDLFCHAAFGVPLQTRQQRAQRVLEDTDFFRQYNVFAQYLLRTLLNKYSQHGPDELKIPDALQVPPISDYGNVAEIAASFGNTDKLRAAVEELQKRLYES